MSFQNYNKSRIHSYRGVRDVDITLDGVTIFRGEIACACGGILGGTEAFGDVCKVWLALRWSITATLFHSQSHMWLLPEWWNTTNYLGQSVRWKCSYEPWIRALCDLCHPLEECWFCHSNIRLLLPTLPLSPFYSSE